MMDDFFGMNMGFFGIFGWVTWILMTVALVLAIVWLWKQIKKK